MLPYLLGPLLLFIVESVKSAPQQSGQGYYDSKFEFISVDTVFANKRLVANYADCLLSKKPCPPQGKELKEILPEAIETNCARCTQKQKEGALRVIHRVQNEYPEIWEQLKATWDPSGDFVRKFEASFNEEPSEVTKVPSLTNRFGDEDELSPNDVNSQSNLDIDPSSFNSRSSTIRSVSTTGIVISTTPTSTTLAPSRKPYWLDKLSSQVLKTAGRIGDMIFGTVEIVLGGRPS